MTLRDALDAATPRDSGFRWAKAGTADDALYAMEWPESKRVAVYIFTKSTGPRGLQIDTECAMEPGSNVQWEPA